MFVAGSALAGDFKVQGEDATAVTVEYTGTVDYTDLPQWIELVEFANGRAILLTINSGGGYAFAGIELYWAMEAYPNLVTYAGSYGAYSAAALMWTAGDYREIVVGGRVALPSAYCDWDSGPNPDIGCDTTKV